MTKHDGPVEESTGLSFDLTQKSDAINSKISYSTTDPGAGSALATGTLFCVYE